MTVPRAACYVADAIVLIFEILFDLWLLSTPLGRVFYPGLSGAIGVPVLLLAWGVLILEGVIAWQVGVSCKRAERERGVGYGPVS